MLLADDDPDDWEIFLEAFARHKDSVVVKTVNSGKELFDFLGAQPADELPSLSSSTTICPLLPADVLGTRMAK